MEDTRKYFDYEFAYKMYKQAVNDFEDGIDELGNNLTGKGMFKKLLQDFSCNVELNENSDINDISRYGAIEFYDDNGIVSVALENINGSYCISGLVTITRSDSSLGYLQHTLYINNSYIIEMRIEELLDYAIEHNYTLEDYAKELRSLEKVKEELLCN